jgi:hypothetical protein
MISSTISFSFLINGSLPDTSNNKSNGSDGNQQRFRNILWRLFDRGKQIQSKSVSSPHVKWCLGHMSALELPKLGHEYHDVTFRNLLPDAVMHDDTASGMSPQ